jgi:uncharacterized OsmC-like protein
MMGNVPIAQALAGLGAAIAGDPAKARAKNVPATARLVEGLKCEVTGPQGQRLATDMAPAFGGGASAPNPGWLLRGALASCTATVIALRAAKLGVTLEVLEVTVDSDSDLRGILGLDDRISAAHSTVRTHVKIRGDAPPETLQEIVSWADAHSPVGCTVRDAATCTLDIQLA